MAGERQVEGIRALTLASDADLEVAFVPSAGMVGCSLRRQGDELLGQRGGLRTYIEQRSTMGSRSCTPGRTAWRDRGSESPVAR
jgi:hypothetical protein